MENVVNNENKKGHIIGFVGFISCGKDTAADYLVNYHEFRRDSFANTLKDSISFVFGWDRILLEGRTKESREWRETVDQWWATRLNMPDLTPRWILQHWGTEVCRNHFHDDIWIASLENKLRNTKDNIVISDVRFPNEMKAIKNLGGSVVRIKRGPEPDWFEHAVNANKGDRHLGWAIGKHRLEQLGIHSSETAWVGLPVDYEITNDGTMADLFEKIEFLIKNQVLNLPVAKVA